MAKLIELAPSVPNDISSWALAVGGAVDGFVLPASPWDTFAAGKHNVVPTMVGTNAHETEILTPAKISTCQSYETAVAEDFKSFSQEVLAEYPCSDYASGRHAYVDVTTDALFGCQARRVLRSLAPAAEDASTSLFRYYYSYVRADPAVTEYRAYHGAEVQLLFGTMVRLGYRVPEKERTLSDIMQESWAALATHGLPILAATPGWEAYEASRDNAVVFDSPIDTADGVGTSHCDFWDARHQ